MFTTNRHRRAAIRAGLILVGLAGLAVLLGVPAHGDEAQTLAADDVGQVVTLGPFECLSERQGLTCARNEGHGFFLGRALVQVK